MKLQVLAGIAAIITAIAAVIGAVNGWKGGDLPSTKAMPATLPQVTNGASSPNISGVGGDVTVTIGVSDLPKVVKPIITDAAETIGYGSRVGMSVTIRQISGKNTENAILVAEHTEENAAEFCRDYSYTARKKCIQDELDTDLSKSVSANCESGVFTTFYRHTLKYEGKRKQTDVLDLAEYSVYDLEKSEYLDGTSASGLDVDLEIFRTLCPKAFRLGEIAYRYPVSFP